MTQITVSLFAQLLHADNVVTDRLLTPLNDGTSDLSLVHTDDLSLVHTVDQGREQWVIEGGEVIRSTCLCYGVVDLGYERSW